MVGRLPSGYLFSEPDPNDGPVLQAIKGALGGANFAADTIFAQPARQVQNFVGPALREQQVASRIAANTNPGQFRYVPGGGRAPLGDISPEIQAKAKERVQEESKTKSGQEQFRAALEDAPFYVRFGAEAATDPWSYVGLGLPGKAAKGAELIFGTGKYAQRFVKALEYTDKLDRTVAEAPGAIVSGGAKAGLDFLGRIPTGGLLSVRDAANIERPARNLGEWATATSRQGWFKQGVRTAANVSQVLRDRGRQLDTDLVNEGEIQASLKRRDELVQELGKPKPSRTTTVADLRADNNRMFETLRGAVMRQTDPNEKAWGFEILRQIDAKVQDIWDQAISRQLSLTPVGRTKSGALRYSDHDYQKVIPMIYADAWYDTQVLLASGLREIYHGTPDAAYALNIARVPELHNAINSTLNDTKNISAQYGTAIGKAKPLPLPSGGERSLIEGGDQARLVKMRNRELQVRYDGGSQAVQSILHTNADYDAIRQLARSRVGDMVSEGVAVKRGLPIVTPYLPDELKSWTANEWHNYSQHADELFGDRQIIYDTLKLAWDRSPAKTTPFPLPAGSFTIRDPQMRWQAVNTVLSQMGKGEAKNIVELRNQLADTLLAYPKRASQWRTLISRWRDAEDVLTADPYEVVFGRIMRAKSKEYGVNTPKGSIKDILQTGTGLWAESNLATLSYPVTNLVGGLVASKIIGVPATRILTNLAKNANAMWHGRPVMVSDLRNVLEKTGQTALEGTSGSTFAHGQTPQKTFLGQGLSSSQRIGSFWLGAGGALIGGTAGALQSDVDEEDRTSAVVHGIITGGLKGAALPLVTKYLLQRFGVGIESVMRQSVYHMGYTKSVTNRLDNLVNAVDQATRLAPVNRVIVDPATQLRKVIRQPVHSSSPASIMRQFKTFLDSNGGLVSPEEVSRKLTEFGMEPQVAGLVGTKWQDELYQAGQDALRLTNKVHVDYEVLNNAEQFARTAMPFSTWPIKMLPFFAKHILESPQVLSTLVHLNQLSQYDMESQGLSSKYAGSVHLGLGDALFSAVLGHPVEAFWNPLRGLLPFADTSRSFENAARNLENGQPISAALNLGNSIGLGLHPLAELPIRLSGAESDAPTQGYDRHAEMIRGLEAALGVNKGRGYDLNAGFTQLESKVRGIIHGEEPTDLRKAAVLRRLDEMALRDTGNVITSGDPSVAPYVAAKASESGDLYLKAEQEVAKERGLTAGLGFFSQVVVPQALLTDEEKQIRGATKANQDVRSQLGITKVKDQLNQLIQDGKDQETVDPKLRDQVIDLANQVPVTHEQADQVRRYLEINTNASMDRILVELFPSPDSGYQSGGTPLESQLGREMAEFTNPAAILSEQGATPEQVQQAGSTWQGYENAGPITKNSMNRRGGGGDGKDFQFFQDANGVPALRQAQDTYRAAHPLLNAYLNWLDMQPPGYRKNSQREFVEAVRSGKVQVGS